MKKILLIPVLLFSTILFAQENTVDKYEKILDKYRTHWKIRLSDVSIEDKKVLHQLYSGMNEVEKSAVTHPIVKLSPKLEIKQPTKEQIDDWKDDNKFGVWIDRERVDNNMLNDYNYLDFSNYTVSKLYKNAVNYGKHYYQVDQMTINYYEEYQLKSIEILVFENEDKNP